MITKEEVVQLTDKAKSDKKAKIEQECEKLLTELEALIIKEAKDCKVACSFPMMKGYYPDEYPAYGIQLFDGTKQKTDHAYYIFNVLDRAGFGVDLDANRIYVSW